MLLSIFLNSCSVNTYELTVDVSAASGVKFIEKLEKRYGAGTEVTVKMHILTDVDVVGYLNGKSLGRQTAIKTGNEYTHWEFYFTMPKKDATLRFEISVVGGNEHVCSLVLLEEIEPTCQKEGLSVIGCTSCGKIFFREKISIIDCVYDENGKCQWCGYKGEELFPWIESLAIEEIVSIKRERKYYGVAPGTLTHVQISGLSEDKTVVIDYLKNLRLSKVPNEYGQIDGGGGVALTIYTATEQYVIELGNGYFYHNGEYYQPKGSIPNIKGELAAFGMICYGESMLLSILGEELKTYENIFQGCVFQEIETLATYRTTHVLSVEGLEVIIQGAKRFFCDGKTYEIINGKDFSQILAEYPFIESREESFTQFRL